MLMMRLRSLYARRLPFSVQQRPADLRSRCSCLTYVLLLSSLGLAIWSVVELSTSQTNLALRRTAIALEANAQAQAPSQSESPWAGASFPVEAFQAYTSPFGYRQHPVLGSRRFHYGLDIAAPMGSYIRNWWDGKVIEVSDHTSCGTAAIAQSCDWTHIYCHMQGSVIWEADGDRVMVDRTGGIEIVQGQMLKAGQRIGRIGVTGRTTGPHLHWGLKYRGSWIDPSPVIKMMHIAQSQG